MLQENLITIAMQKSGRLSEDSIGLMQECGLKFDAARGSARLKSKASNFPLEFIFLRDDDIGRYVADGVVDAGIIGENVLYEQLGEDNSSVRLIERLGFSKCRLSIAVPKNQSYSEIKDLAGLRIATSHPNILKRFLCEKKVQSDIHEISGSVEIAPSLNLAEAICDLVSSGSTLAGNGLKEVEVVLDSQAVLIARTLGAAKQNTLDKLLFRIQSVIRAKQKKYVLLNAPNEQLQDIVKLLPAMKSPTVVPLADSGWSAVHAFMHEDEFWEKIESLREAGAKGILILPIEKMIV